MVVDWIYRIPINAKPQYLVFRRVAKRAINPEKIYEGRMPPQGSALDRSGALEDVRARYRRSRR